MNIVAYQPKHLSKQKLKDIELQVDNAISNYHLSRTELIKFTTECTALCTATGEKLKALINQGVLKRFFALFTNQNIKIQEANISELEIVQYFAQQSIIKLSEKNALTMEMAVTIGNRVEGIENHFDDIHQKMDKMVTVWDTLDCLVKNNKSKIVKLNSRIDNLEQNQKLLFWKETIEDKLFNGTEYYKLPVIHKIVCVASEFYDITCGKWTVYDLKLILRPVMREIGIDTKGTIKPYKFYKEFIKTPLLYTKLIIDNNLDNRSLESPVHSPILFGIYKLEKLNGKENYIVKTVINQLLNTPIKINKLSIILNLLTNYLNELCNFDIQLEIKTFDFIIELLSGMEVLNAGNIKDPLKENTIEQKSITIFEPDINFGNNKGELIPVSKSLPRYKKNKITQRTLIPSIFFDKKRLHKKLSDLERKDCYHAISIATNFRDLSHSKEHHFHEPYTSYLKEIPHAKAVKAQLYNNKKKKIYTDDLIEVHMIKNRTFVQQGEIIAHDSIWYDNTKGTGILLAPSQGTIFWLINCWNGNPLFDAVFYLHIATSDHRIENYYNRNKIEHYHYITPYEIMGIISNENDTSDNIIDWIFDKKIMLPNSFFNKKGEYIYPDFHSNEKYRKKLIYTVH